MYAKQKKNENFKGNYEHILFCKIVDPKKYLEETFLFILSSSEWKVMIKEKIAECDFHKLIVKKGRNIFW